MKNGILYRGAEALGPAAVADTWLLRLRGLIARDVRELGGLLIDPCNQIHTFHMSYPIDVVYLSKEGTVVKTEAAVKPNRVCATVKGAGMTLELPEGDILRLEIRPGDHLQVC